MHHASVIPALVGMMGNSTSCRVQAHGAAALVNFCEKATKMQVEPYLDGILKRLQEMLQSQHTIVLEQTMTCIATVADTAGKLFQKYFPHFIPLLKHVLVSANAEKYGTHYPTSILVTLRGP